MANRNYLTWSHSILSCALLFVVVVLLNVVVARAGVRVDLTEESLYTLDDGSKNILKRLRDPVSLTVYWGNVPAQSASAERFIQGLLEEMQEIAGDRLSVTWVDTDEEEGQQQAEKDNIRPYRFPRIEGNKRVETIGYMTMLVESGADAPSMIPKLGLIYTQLEGILVAELDKRSRLAPPTIGFLNPDSPLFLTNDITGRGVPGRFNYLKDEWLRRRTFGKQLQDVRSLEEPVPADIDVLLVIAPWQLPEVAVFHLEQFALRGGRIVLLLDSVNAENTILPNQEREPRSSGLDEWLAHLGVTVEYGVVGDFNGANQAIYPFNREEQGPYPYWPLLTQDNMDTTNIVMGSIRAMPMVWPAAITIDDARMKATKRRTTVLARTSPLGHRRAEIAAVADKLSHPVPSTKELESIPLIVMVEGPLESLWKGKPRPKTPAEIAEAAAKEAEEERRKAEAEKEAEQEAEGAGGPGEEAAGSPDGEAPPKAPAPEAPEDDAADPGKPPAPPADDPKPAGGDGGEGDDGEDPPADDGKDDEAPGDEAPGDEAGEEETDGPPRVDTGEIKILIASDAEFCADYLGPQQHRSGLMIAPVNGEGGFAFVVGAADWLSGGEDLIGLRARDTNPRQLESIEPSEQKTIQVVNLGAVPFLLLCIGIVVFAVRRSQRS